jgi:hypothetical protein
MIQRTGDRDGGPGIIPDEDRSGIYKDEWSRISYHAPLLCHFLNLMRRNWHRYNMIEIPDQAFRAHVSGTQFTGCFHRTNKTEMTAGSDEPA